MANASNRPLNRPPLKLIEGLIKQLRDKSISETGLSEPLNRIKESLKMRFDSAETRNVVEQAVERAPWLTSDAERLKRSQEALIQTLQSCCIRAENQTAPSDPPGSFIELLSDFAELYVEAESAQEELLHTAFPGPEWTK